MTIDLLEPQPLWQHFAQICQFPRPSKHESALRDHLQAWATARQLQNELDAVGNLIIRKPATAGMADRVGVILQGHLDMVAQKNEATQHDFLTDPIVTQIHDGWVKASGTTLGADNGIGVAAALAILESTDIAHGPLEVLLTIDEEAGMTGAQGLQAGLLQGQLLFNLDTEDWGEIYVGCAGGVDITLSRSLHHEAIPAGYVLREVAVTGLQGGHSGVDIHLQRGNAIKLLAGLMSRAIHQFDARVVHFRGGTLRNALPREAFAQIAIPACDEARFNQLLDEVRVQLTQAIAKTDPKASLLSQSLLGSDTPNVALSAADSLYVVDMLLALPHGVHRWSSEIADVVETSNNLGVVKIDERRFEAVLMLRSLTDLGLQDLSRQIEAISRLGKLSFESSGEYPGWAPNPQSRALQLLLQVYQAHYGQPAAVKVIHAGLECGLIGRAYPQLEMVSFGPTIRGAHSPDERVEIESVGQFWQLLQAALAAVPTA
ncbi:aminoacyl-histidine dipeptidase [Chitinibacter bivalviorum]|uniref:Cytosol non-specific dipeptidase n=1 Tax=Chitinibacter bivalviorum TaxID=2739434 RepID=A0A7H9BFU2_9NEIS|nr:aminoacyl-histidine dipeptidase [Chitinibacter bivalviorum]QLG87489.1 aminoacyl-histidine dipeptidase [Chitinibacter bivalviorum]